MKTNSTKLKQILILKIQICILLLKEKSCIVFLYILIEPLIFHEAGTL